MSQAPTTYALVRGLVVLAGRGAPNPTQYEPSTRGLVIAAQACRLDVGCVVSGSRMANREPTPGVLVTVMWPVCWVMIHNAMARPSPVPVVAAALRPR